MRDVLGWEGPLTHRQFLLLRAYLADDWNRPSRSDHYLMRVAQRVHQTVVKEPNKVTLDMQRVEFKPAGPAKPAVVYKTPEEAAEAAKRGSWGWLMGMARNCPPEYKVPLVQPVSSPDTTPSSSQGEVREDRESVREKLRSMWSL